MGHPTNAVVAFVEWLITPSQDSFTFIEVVNAGMMRGSWSARRKPFTFVRGGRKHLEKNQFLTECTDWGLNLALPGEK